MWKVGIFLIYLLILSIFDIRERRISVLLLAAGSIFTGIVVTYELFAGYISWLQPVLGSLPGIFLLLVAWFSKKAGYADGVVLLWIGVLYGYREGLSILGVSLFLVSMTSVLLLILRKVKKQTRIPYIPFLAVGFTIVNFMC